MVMDEKIYVAVTGRDVESKSSLIWAIQNSGGREFSIVYVHQPFQELRLYRKEMERAHKSLDKYLNICRQMQVGAEKICIEMDSVEEGILHLVSNHGVKKLVMGAAADRHYSMRMRALQSKKAIYIHREAPATCHIWFTCKGYLICSREGKKRDYLYLECASLNSSSKSEITKGTESLPSSSKVKDDDQIQVTDAIKRAKHSENVYINELKRRKETEKVLRKTKEELEKMIRKLQYKYSLSLEAFRRLRQEQEELKIELREVSKLKSNRKNHGPPQYFICPITQDVMEDPHVAADGFTYEGEAISSWFERGHETSPMTNKRLPHTSLVPNLALRSTIQEWLQASTS
ncbi:U box domain-containing protein [Hirschfeldia incana]|nr:U box domain-containing protein [Hirschfeldia incana]